MSDYADDRVVALRCFHCGEYETEERDSHCYNHPTSDYGQHFDIEVDEDGMALPVKK